MLEWWMILGAWLLSFLPNMAINVFQQIKAGNETESEHQRYNRFALTWLIGFVLVATAAALSALPLVGLPITVLYAPAAYYWWQRRTQRGKVALPKSLPRAQGASTDRLALPLMFCSAALLIVFIGAGDAISELLAGEPRSPFDKPPYTLWNFFNDRWPHVLVALIGLFGLHLWLRGRDR